MAGPVEPVDEAKKDKNEGPEEEQPKPEGSQGADDVVLVACAGLALRVEGSGGKSEARVPWW